MIVQSAMRSSSVRFPGAAAAARSSAFERISISVRSRPGCRSPSGATTVMRPSSRMRGASPAASTTASAPPSSAASASGLSHGMIRTQTFFMTAFF